MPEGTRVHRCVDKLKSSVGLEHAIPVCQSSTKQSYQTGLELTGRKKKSHSDGKRR